jgi:hypothetical protein
MHLGSREGFKPKLKAFVLGDDYDTPRGATKLHVSKVIRDLPATTPIAKVIAHAFLPNGQPERISELGALAVVLIAESQIRAPLPSVELIFMNLAKLMASTASCR